MGINLLRNMDLNLFRKVRRETPEERELNRKLSELELLEERLAQHELDLTTLKAELYTLENCYLSTVGVLYAELDEIEAQIAETIAYLNPNDGKAKEQAAKARAQAQESAEVVGDIQEQKETFKFKPSKNLRELYWEIAKRIHPDLAVDEEEYIRRKQLMAEANGAYEDGDEERLKAILREWESSPESVEGDGIGAELIRVIRQIARVEERLHGIQIEITQLEESDLYKLKTRIEENEKDGEDILGEMVNQVEKRIAGARERLAEVKGKLRA